MRDQGTSSNTRQFIVGFREALRNSPRRIARWWWAVGVVLLLSGCAATAPYKDALHRFGASGRAIQPHLKPTTDESVKALYESFDAAISEAEKIK